MSRMRKVLPLMIASLSTLGGTAVNASSAQQVADVQKTDFFSNYKEFRTERDFETSMRLALNDMSIRLRCTEKDVRDPDKMAKCRFKYEAKLTNGEKVDIVSQFLIKDDPDLHVHMRSIVDQGISLLDKNNKIYLPVFGNYIYMTDDARELLSKWKKEGIYDSKINAIIDSHMNVVYQHWNDRLKNPMKTNEDIMEGRFAYDMKSLLSDIKLRLVFPNEPIIFDVPEYNVKLTNGKVINISTPKELNGTSFRYMIDKVLNILEKNTVMLPTLNREISISPETQNLLDRWKREGKYDSKINDIIKSFEDSFMRRDS